MQISFTLYISGYLLLFLGSAMFIPAGLDYFQGKADFAFSFVSAASITIFWGSLFIVAFKGMYKKPTTAQMYLATTLTWILVCSFAAIPFVVAPYSVSYTDAFFEAMSGLSTTGASIYSDLSKCSDGIILWRSLLHWFGGLGIVALAMLLLPFLRIGGMQLFQMESSDKNDKMKPRTVQVICTIAAVYVVATILCLLCLWMTELDFFDALNFSLATIPTGGFSPVSTSAVNLSAAAQWIIAFFMFISGMPLFSLYFIYKREFKRVVDDIQIKTYFWVVAIISAVLTGWIIIHYPQMDYLKVFRTTLFNVISVISSTGFNASNLETGGAFVIAVFTFLTVVGACTGSTTGGIKLFRFNILTMAVVQSLQQKLMPHAVLVPKFNHRPVTLDIVLSVLIFIIMFCVTAIISVLLLSVCGLDFLTSVSAVFSALGNTGIGVGPVIGSSGPGFCALPSFAKWVLSVDMLLGRLEFMSIFILILPMAWKRDILGHNKAEASF